MKRPREGGVRVAQVHQLEGRVSQQSPAPDLP